MGAEASSSLACSVMSHCDRQHHLLHYILCTLISQWAFSSTQGSLFSTAVCSIMLQLNTSSGAVCSGPLALALCVFGVFGTKKSI